jgi:hypothetical protein
VKVVKVVWIVEPVGLIQLLVMARVAQVAAVQHFGMPQWFAALVAMVVVEECLFTDNYHGISNHRF